MKRIIIIHLESSKAVYISIYTYSMHGPWKRDSRVSAGVCTNPFWRSFYIQNDIEEQIKSRYVISERNLEEIVEYYQIPHEITPDGYIVNMQQI